MTMTPFTTMTTKSKRPKQDPKCTQTRNGPIVKIHGGKFYLARRHIALFPQHFDTYIEPCIGGGSVFLNLNPKTYLSAVINDLHRPTYCLWHALRYHHEELIARLRLISYTQEEFEQQRDILVLPDSIESAVKHYCMQRMSRGGMGKDFAWSDRLRGGQPGDLNAWINSIDNLYVKHEHMAVTPNLEVRNQHLFAILQEHASNPNAFVYIDPPYLHETRTSKKIYANEMTREEHETMLPMICAAKAKIMICGYHSELYDTTLAHWCNLDFEMANHSGQGKSKKRRVETIWMNY
jgi:DNA adenine methylase